MIVAVCAESPENCSLPPERFVIVAWPALLLPRKIIVLPSSLLIVARPAELVPAKLRLEETLSIFAAAPSSTMMPAPMNVRPGDVLPAVFVNVYVPARDFSVIPPRLVVPVIVTSWVLLALNVAVPRVGTVLSGVPAQLSPVLKSAFAGATAPGFHVASPAWASVVGSAADANAELASSMIRRRDARRGAARRLAV